MTVLFAALVGFGVHNWLSRKSGVEETHLLLERVGGAALLGPSDLAELRRPDAGHERSSGPVRNHVEPAATNSEEEPVAGISPVAKPPVYFQDVLSEDFDLDPNEVNSLANKFARIDGEVQMASLLSLDSITSRVAEEQPVAAQEITNKVAIYTRQLDDYVEELAVRYGDCQDDWLLNGGFQLIPRSQGVPVARERHGSYVFSDIVIGIGGFYADLGFRSAEYPEFNRQIGYALQVKSLIVAELEGMFDPIVD